MLPRVVVTGRTALLSGLLLSCGKPFFNPPPPPLTLEDSHAIPSSLQAIYKISVYNGCGMLRCPMYSFTLNRDGTAIYEGGTGAPMTGRYIATIDSSTFSGFATLLMSSGFFTWTRSKWSCDDCAEGRILVMFDSTGKEVRTGVDPNDSRPDKLKWALDSAAADLRWASAR